MYTPIQQCISAGLRKFRTVELTFDTKSFTPHIQRGSREISYVFSTFYEEILEVKKMGTFFFPENEIFVVKE